LAYDPGVMSRVVRQAFIGGAAVIALLAVVSGLVWVLEDRVGVPNASSVFLLAVVVAASRFGTATAIATAIGGFLVYDLFFIQPVLNLTVSDPGEWLNLVLLLIVGIVVARLAAGQRERAEAAILREREAVSLFRVSRALATRPSTTDVLPELAAILRADAAMERVRITIATMAGLERTAVDTEVVKAVGDSAAAGHPGASNATAWTPPASHHALRRTPGDAPAEWIRVHQSTAAPSAASRRGRGDSDAYRVLIEVGDRRLGSIWAVRPRSDGPPDAAQTQLLSAAADQIGQALEQDRLGREAREMEIARRSDALKTALLESVSHDLRTPLTSIRAAAGTLLDRTVPLDAGGQEATAQAIDREAEHLNRLVTNLLDLSRIEAGELRSDPEPFELSTLVVRVVDRLRPLLAGRTVEIDVRDDLPPVLVDEVFIDQVLTNLIENAIKYTGPSARIRVSASGPSEPDGARQREDVEWSDSGAPIPAGTASAHVRPVVRLTVEDDGPGVPDDVTERLFDRFFRVRRRGEPSRPGSGIGLTVVRGLVEAMGGRVRASRSSLGGLAINMTLPSVAPLASGGDAT
jgi:two-component system, OmpR family, sensor histidine kinase KdpD